MEIDHQAAPHFEDSDDEREYKDQQKNAFSVEFKLDNGELQAGSQLIVLEGGLSQAVARIIHEESWKQVASGEASFKDEKEKEKTDVMFKVYHTGANFYLLVPETKMKGRFVNKLVKEMLAKTKFGSYLVLDEIYRTQYGAGDESSHLLTYQSSFVTEAHSAWLKKNGAPAHFTAPTGGLGASLLVHSEMHGLPAIKLTVITDGHYYSSEMMQQCYEKTFKEFGMGDVSDIQARKSFKAVLKEANQRGNSIFS